MDTSSTSQQLIVRPTSQVQVAPSHYAFEDYDDKERWASYWHQIRNTLRLSPRPRSILEIGGGTGLYRSYLANQGIEVRTADIDDTRKPDYLADVRDLDRTLPAGLRFDAVVAFQVLEHLPFAALDDCLAGIARRANPYALISLPYHGWAFRFALRIAGLRLSTGFKLWKPWRFKFDGEHHWELGWQHTPRSITRRMERHFEVLDRFLLPENPYHYLWVLRTRQAGSASAPAPAAGASP